MGGDSTPTKDQHLILGSPFYNRLENAKETGLPTKYYNFFFSWSFDILTLKFQC